MSEGSYASARPTRLSVFAKFLVLTLLGLSFFSGLLIWWGKTVQLRDLTPPSWLRSAVVLHGSLYPFLCGLFGYLVCQHIRGSWELRANLASGFTLESIFLLLILTGLGLYYGPAGWQEAMAWAHRWAGALMPLSLGWHWCSGQRWGNKQK